MTVSFFEIEIMADEEQLAMQEELDLTRDKNARLEGEKRKLQEELAEARDAKRRAQGAQQPGQHAQPAPGAVFPPGPPLGLGAGHGPVVLSVQALEDVARGRSVAPPGLVNECKGSVATARLVACLRVQSVRATDQATVLKG